MVADQEALNIEKGESGDPNNPFVQGWMSRVRARKVLSDNINKRPFTRIWGSIKAVASPMSQDKITAIADAVGWRIVQTQNPDVPGVLDYGDMELIRWYYFMLTADPEKLRQAVALAKQFNKWPTGYVGIADFEAGT